MKKLAPLLIIAAALTTTACLQKKTSNNASPAPSPDPSSGDDFANFGGKPTKLQADEEALFAEANACIQVSFSIVDAEDFAVSTEKDIQVGLSSNPANGSLFFSDNKCATSVKTVAVSKSGSGAEVFVKMPGSGAIKVTFADTAQGGLAASTTTITAVAVSQLGSRGAGIPQFAGDCAPQSVLAQDSEGHPVFLAKEATLTVSTSASTGSFYADEECTKTLSSSKIEAGKSESESIYYKDTAIGSPTLTFASSSQTAWKKATLNLTVTKDDAGTP